MKKDIKKVLYESIMTSVAKKVKKVLNESEELVDKQAQLKDLKQEYASLSSKIDDMWAEYSQKMAVTTDVDAQREISNNFYKSLEPLKAAVRNKTKEIYNLTDEISELKQAASQPEFSKKSNYSDNNYDDEDNNYEDDEAYDNDYEDDEGEHKFRVIRYTDKQLKNYDSEDYSGEDYVRCFVFDANEEFLPDFTPDWLYDILDNIDYMEFEESIFEMGEKSYDYLINHPDCVEHRYATNAEAYGDGEEYDEDEYGEDEEYYNDDEIKEKLSNIILNPDFKVKAGGRFAPKGGKDKLDLISLYGKDKKDIHKILAESPKLEQVRKDIKYDIDFENGYIDHQGTTKDGIDYLALLVHGDWEEPVAIFVYWDGKKYRGYIPTRGNAINTINRSAFGNDEDADNEYCTKYLGLKDYYGCDGCAFGLPINWDACLEEFETRLVVK